MSFTLIKITMLESTVSSLSSTRVANSYTSARGMYTFCNNSLNLKQSCFWAVCLMVLNVKFAVHQMYCDHLSHTHV